MPAFGLYAQCRRPNNRYQGINRPRPSDRLLGARLVDHRNIFCHFDRSAQKRDLKTAGAERFYFEQTSSVGPREELERAIDFAREGDVLVVTKLDRLARSVTHLGELMGRLEEKGIALRILGMGVDTGTPTGRLMVNLLGSIAQFEREVMLERQREGIAKAKAEGKYRGRKPTARAMAAQVMQMRRDGVTKEAIAAKLGIGVATSIVCLGIQETKRGANVVNRLCPELEIKRPPHRMSDRL
jgi:DNA invertase Pin-like site-specific DNA recombinase